jgi:para-aminobenzoate synthetase/4-amino-4-deoxychorismate lyase
MILRDAANAVWLHFENPLEIVSISKLDEVVPALRRIEALVESRGWYAAGLISYEAAPAFDEAFKTRPAGDFPLIWFGLYSAPRSSSLTPSPLPMGEGLGVRGFALEAWTPSVTRAAYAAAISQIKEHIASGETYQVNYTFRLGSKFTGNPWSLFIDMLKTQPVEYPAFVDTGRHVICCASPELFFRLEGQDVTCRPMKGTARRGRTLAEDEAQAEALKASPKERAENVMIVDMLRNDLGRIAHIGSVQAPALFNVERYRTLWQMTSTVTARVSAPFTDLLAALFPCASITGAPKISTMGIIAALENAPRKAYTGAIGFLAPARRAQFNVAIRSALIDRETGNAEYGTGSGVVWDSTAGDEYAESLLKARALPRWRRASGVAHGRHDAARLTEPQPEFSLLETLRWTPVAGWFLAENHLKRLHDSAIYFGFPFDSPAIEARLAAIAKTFNAPMRVRLLLHPDGALAHEAFALPPSFPPFLAKFSPKWGDARGAKPLRVKLAAAPIDDQDVFLFHKTTRRAVYENARAAQPACDDVLLYNQRGELTEATIANLVVERDSVLVTPPISCGLLAGTFRAMLLEQGVIQEQVIRREELARCTKLFLVNSVRGWMDVEVVKE